MRGHEISINDIEYNTPYLLKIIDDPDNPTENVVYRVYLESIYGEVLYKFRNINYINGREIDENNLKYISIDMEEPMHRDTHTLYTEIPNMSGRLSPSPLRVSPIPMRTSPILHGGKKRKRTTKRKKNDGNKRKRTTKRKKSGGATDIEEYKKYKIRNPTIDDYSNTFGSENGTIYFKNRKIYKYSLYKIPLDKERIDRIRCADNRINESELYTYAYINNSDCSKWKEGVGIECEMNHVFGKYTKLLNQSNPYSKTFDQDVENCVKHQQLKQSVSPISVAEVKGVEESKENDNIFDFRSFALTEKLGGKRRTRKSKRKTKNGGGRHVVGVENRRIYYSDPKTLTPDEREKRKELKEKFKARGTQGERDRVKQNKNAQQMIEFRKQEVTKQEVTKQEATKQEVTKSKKTKRNTNTNTTINPQENKIPKYTYSVPVERKILKDFDIAVEDPNVDVVDSNEDEFVDVIDDLDELDVPKGLSGGKRKKTLKKRKLK